MACVVLEEENAKSNTVLNTADVACIVLMINVSPPSNKMTMPEVIFPIKLIPLPE